MSRKRTFEEEEDVVAEKRVKTGKDPIVIALPRTKPDIRMFVFGQEFHVSSGPLKRHSLFFRTFLKPSGGLMPSSSKEGFKGDWYTQLDKILPARWCLTSDPKFRDADLSSMEKESSFQINTFKKFLYVLFDSHYFEIKGLDQLRHLTNMAHYYCALPKLSAAIDYAFPCSPHLMTQLHIYPCEMLVIATELRHKRLFNDALIFALGPWSKPAFKKLADMGEMDLYEMACGEYGKMKDKILKAHKKVLLYCPTERVGRAVAEASSQVGRSRMFLPAFFRHCLPDGYKCLLENKLKMVDREAEAGVGVGPYESRVWSRSFKDRFLCFEFEKFPWCDWEEDCSMLSA